MALQSVRKKFEAARKDYEKQRKALGKELRAALVEVIAEVIPEGWYVRWSHSDQMYNDEVYYWGFNFIQLVTLKVPRTGKLLKEAVPRTYKTERRYGHEEKVIDNYGSPEEYEYLLDDECEKRDDFVNVDWDDPGIVDVRESEWPTDDNHEVAMPFGLTEDDCNAVWNLIYRLKQDELQQAFGDIATVVVFKNGKCKVNNESED